MIFGYCKGCENPIPLRAKKCRTCGSTSIGFLTLKRTILFSIGLVLIITSVLFLE